MRAILLLLFIIPWPTAISVSSSELERGHDYIVTATTPSGADVGLRIPPGTIAGRMWRKRQTVTWWLSVRPDAPLSRTPVSVGLIVNGVEVASAPVRIWQDGPFRVALPILRT